MVFQTAKIVRVVSPVVAVVISVVAAPPLVRLQPPKVYPLREVVAVLSRDEVDTRRESEVNRVEDSDAGTVEARVFPSKTIVGLVAGVALAEVGIAVIPARQSRAASTVAVVFLCSDLIIELKPFDM